MLGLGLSLTTGGVITPYYAVVANAFRDRVEADGGTVESMSCLKKDLKVLNPVKPPAFTGLLNDYSGAAAAYSLRLLDNTYTGDAIVVRRASDNTTQAIGFVNNELDTATLESFCSGADGFVTTWYDQSGNGNDAVNAAAASQPQIVISGSIVLDNNKPAVEFRGTNNQLNADSVASYFSGTDEYLSNAMVWKTKSSASLAAFWGMGSSSSATPLRWFGVDASSTTIRLDERDNANTLTTTTGGDCANQNLTFVSSNMDSKTIYVDGVSVATDSGSFGSTTLNRFAFGYLPRTSNALFATGLIQECIFYNSDQSTNRSGIETNINDFYSIY